MGINECTGYIQGLHTTDCFSSGSDSGYQLLELAIAAARECGMSYGEFLTLVISAQDGQQED